MKLQIRRLAHARDIPLPRYETPGAAGLDLSAAIKGERIIEPGAKAMIPCGISIAVAPGFEAQVRPRSGLAAKNGVTVLNAPGTIDSDYRGEVAAILINHGTESFTVTRGMRIAQMVIAPVVQAELVEVEALDETSRGAGGFGSTGTAKSS
jgi:dUTP pyrophosphatase